MKADLLDHPLIGERYFFPRRGHLNDPFWVDCGDARLACHYHQVDPSARTLIHFHGNGEIVDDYLGDFVSLVGRMGCNCLLVEFRGYGLSGGRPALGRMLADVPPVIRALGQPAEQLIFFGRSVGSIFAIEAATRYPEASGLILESGVADVLERLLLRVDPAELGTTREQLAQAVADRLDHRQKLARYQGPVLVMHTLNDGLVDVSHGRRLYQWAQGRKRLQVFPRGNHNDIMFENAREYFRLLAEFIAGLGHAGGDCFFD